VVRLQKILSLAGVASRRAAETLITQGRVEVNGHVVSTLGSKADPATDVNKVDGRRLKFDADRRYLLMYKPRGVVSTRIDPQKRTTVVDLVARAGIRGYFYPVGRLDYDSEGLIILTNDGDFAEHVAHPRYEVDRTYEALVEGIPDERDLERLRRGVIIAGGRTEPAEVRVIHTSETKRGPQTTIVVRLHEGRNRQIRRMCDTIAHPIARLKRVRIGSLGIGDLRPGDFRDLSPAEIRKLAGGAASAASPRK
jgi:23S rRNA pseudouridine2605 synthase